MLKIAIFWDLLDFTEYSTGVEYSMGHKKFFLNYKIDKDTPKNFHVNTTISFENMDRGNPPPRIPGI